MFKCPNRGVQRILMLWCFSFSGSGYHCSVGVRVTSLYSTNQSIGKHVVSLQTESEVRKKGSAKPRQRQWKGAIIKNELNSDTLNWKYDMFRFIWTQRHATPHSETGEFFS